jgi:hypothetical protein
LSWGLLQRVLTRALRWFTLRTRFYRLK